MAGTPTPNRGYQTVDLDDAPADIEAAVNPGLLDVDADVEGLDNDLATTMADLQTHKLDAAHDGGPHGFPALADGQGWVKVGGVLVSTNVATQAELDAAIAAEAAARDAADVALDARLDVLEAMPRVRMHTLVAGSNGDAPNDNSSPVLQWTEAGEDYDIGGLHGAANLDRITFPSAGVYVVKCRIETNTVSAGANAYRSNLELILNAANTQVDEDWKNANEMPGGGAGQRATLFAQVERAFAAGDYIRSRLTISGVGGNGYITVMSAVFQARKVA